MMTGMSLVVGNCFESLEDLASRQVRQIQIKEDDIGDLTASQVEPYAALHGGQECDLRTQLEDDFDQPQIRKIVLNAQDGARARGIVACNQFLSTLRRQSELILGRGRARELHGESRALAGRAFRFQGAPHGRY